MTERKKAYMKKYNQKPEIKEKKRQWRLNNLEYSKKWNQAHPERPNGNNTRTPSQWRVHNKAGKIPLTKSCELCPENDNQIAVHRHHPDYDYPTIFVSCCASCHNYVEKGGS